MPVGAVSFKGGWTYGLSSIPCPFERRQWIDTSQKIGSPCFDNTFTAPGLFSFVCILIWFSCPHVALSTRLAKHIPSNHYRYSILTRGTGTFSLLARSFCLASDTCKQPNLLGTCMQAKTEASKQSEAKLLCCCTGTVAPAFSKVASTSVHLRHDSSEVNRWVASYLEDRMDLHLSDMSHDCYQGNGQSERDLKGLSYPYDTHPGVVWYLDHNPLCHIWCCLVPFLVFSVLLWTQNSKSSHYFQYFFNFIDKPKKECIK